MNVRLDNFRLSDRALSLACFFLLVVPLVVYCAWKVPLGQAPDEPTHIARAESVLRGEMIGYRVKTHNPSTDAPNAGVTGNFGLVLASSAATGSTSALPASVSARARLAWAEAVPWSPAPMFISSVNTAAYAPIAYMPAAAALGVAIAQGARPYAAAVAARFGNVLTFTILGALALLLAGRGQLLLLMTLGLPITVWLAGSCNQDGILIAVAVLALALLTRRGRPSFWAGTALLALLALQKPPFVALMLLPLAAPRPAPFRWSGRIAAALLVLVPATLWSVLVMRHVSVPLLPSAIYHPGPLWPGDPNRSFHSAIPAAQLQVMRHHPLKVALLPLLEPKPGFAFFNANLIGILGPNVIWLPKPLYLVFDLALLSAIAALLTTAPATGLKRWAFLLTLVAAFGCGELMYMVEYLTWTPVGFARIDGMQGRYFVPLLPMLTLLVGRLLPLPARLGWIWWIAPVVALVALDTQLPGIIAAHYYR